MHVGVLLVAAAYYPPVCACIPDKQDLDHVRVLELILHYCLLGKLDALGLFGIWNTSNIRGLGLVGHITVGL